MILPDVNVLLYAYRQESTKHVEFKLWLENCINSPSPFGLSEQVLSSVVRILTHSKIYKKPTPLDKAVDYVSLLKNQPNAVIVRPGNKHWPIFTELCISSSAKGNIVADAYHAALAIESGCEWITTDRDFARFKNLKWRHPLS